MTIQSEHQIAFKEWACIVKVLGQGKQILILRKGGIREEGGEFQVEYDEFFLFPTYEHQKKSDLKPQAHRELDLSIQEKPGSGQIPIQYYAKAAGVLHLTEESDLERLSPYHVWSDQAVRQRFEFGRQKGLFALAVRIFQLPAAHWIPSDPEYGGCKSWVSLKQKPAAKGAQAVLSDPDFNQKWREISSLFPSFTP